MLKVETMDISSFEMIVERLSVLESSIHEHEYEYFIMSHDNHVEFKVDFNIRVNKGGWIPQGSPTTYINENGKHNIILQIFKRKKVA